MRSLTPLALLLLSLAPAHAEELPPPAGGSDFPPPLAPADRAPPLRRKDMPAARIARNDPAPKPAPASGKPAVVVDLSGSWSDADSREAAAALSTDCAAGAWVARFKRAHSRPPRVKVLEARNHTSNVLNLSFLTRELRAGLGVLAAKGRPDVILAGHLLAQNDAEDGKELQSFLLAYTAVDLESFEKLWIGLHRVRKLVTRSAGKSEVKRIKPGVPGDLSGYVNDTDADTLSQTLLRDLLASRLLARTPAPVLQFESIANRSSERVKLAFLSALLEHGVLRSGKARLVCEEYEVETDAKPRARLAASYLVSGALTLLARATAGGEVRHYTIALHAARPDGRKEWLKRASVKKLVARR